MLIGHLLTLLHFGSMPHELCLKNIDLFCHDVLPHLEDFWDDQWQDRWSPERLNTHRPAVAAAAGVESRRIQLWQDKIQTEAEISGVGRRWFFCTVPGGCATVTA